MNSATEIKEMVRQKYSEIALQDKETKPNLLLRLWLLFNGSLQHHERRLQHLGRP